jgi:hypothetical protein
MLYVLMAKAGDNDLSQANRSEDEEPAELAEASSASRGREGDTVKYQVS